MSKENASHLKGLFALSPLLIFFVTYFVTGVLAKDFYRVPLSSAFLVASVYAVFISKGKISERIEQFSKGAANSDFLMMIWIFILAGAFASSAKAIGSVEATVVFTLTILPSNLIYAGLFLSACFVSLSIGTSVGTVAALVPIAAGAASEMGVDPAFLSAIIVSGAFFGDNLSFISDTTIAATKSQGCTMTDKFKANIWIAVIAALISALIYFFLGKGCSYSPEIKTLDWVLLLPYVSIIILSVLGVNVLGVLAIGLVLNLVIGLAKGSISWIGYMESVGNGIEGMGGLIIVTILAAGILEIVRKLGGLDYMIALISKALKNKRGAEFGIAGLVSIATICTANNTVAIITTGGMAKKISDKFKLNPKKVASILDCYSCAIQGLLPYGAQILMGSTLAGVSSFQILSHLHYPLILGAVASLVIVFRFPRKYS